MSEKARVILAGVLLALAGGAQAAQIVSPFPAQSGYAVGTSPDGSALDVVLEAIDAAKSQVLVAAYTFTSKPIAQALVAAQRRGVKVFVVADKARNSGRYSAVRYLASQGVAVRLNGRYQDMHDKYMVIDGLHVETGSFNYSASAARRNAENALVLVNVRPLAQRYRADWSRLWQEAEPLTAAGQAP